MKNITLLTDDDKKLLRSFSRYAQSWGLSEIIVRLDLEGTSDLSSIPVPNHFENAYDKKFPVVLHNFLESFKNKVDDQVDIEYADVDELNYEAVEIRIDTEDENIEFIYEFSYTTESETRGLSFDDVEDPEIKSFFPLISEETDEDYLTLRYYGSGDSGYLESNFEEGPSVPSGVDDWCYRILEGNFGGWEINEGSQGRFAFDMDEKTINLEHTENYEQNDSDTFYSESFAK